MKFVYPIQNEDLDERDYAASYGNYPLSSYNTWHGGIHRDNAHGPLVAISDARVIAYRLPAAYLTTDHATPETYSNGFVLLQHHYQSPEGQELTFYTLYHHVAGKDVIDDPARRLKVPRFLAKGTASVKVANLPKGVRGRAAIAGPGQNRGPEVALIPKGFKLFRNDDRLLAPWAAAYNATRSADRSQYHSYAYTDPFSGTSYANIHVFGGTLTKVEGTANQYKVTYDGDGVATSGGASATRFYPDLQPGALLYDVPDDFSGQPGDGFAIGTVPKDTQVTMVPDGEHAGADWTRVEGHNGYLRLADLAEDLIWKDDLSLDTVVGCDFPVAAGEVVGYVGKFGFKAHEEQPTSHLELFTDAPDAQVNDFLGNAKGDGADSYQKYVILAGTELQPAVASNKSLAAGTSVEVKEISGNFARLRVQGIVREVQNERDIAVDKSGGTYVREQVAGDNRIRYSIVPERFAYVNGLFGGQLSPGSKVYLEEMLTGNTRRVLIDAPDAGKEFWVDASATGGAARNAKIDLPAAVSRTYVGQPYPVPPTGNTFQADHELNSLPDRKVTDDDGQEWLFVDAAYAHGGTSYNHVGWLRSTDPNLKQLNPFDWTAFGFCTHDGGEEYVYSLQDYIEQTDTHAFIQAVWNQADGDGDRVLTPMELLAAQMDPPRAERMGRMVVKHKNEWSYAPAKIRSEAVEYFAPGIEIEENPARKQELERERDAQLDPLVGKLTKLMLWDEVQAAPFTPAEAEEDRAYEAEKERIQAYYRSASYRLTYPADSAAMEERDLDALDREYKKGKYETEASAGRRLPGSAMVWHWNLHSFVRQMRLMFGNTCKYLKLGDRNELVRELNIRLAGFGGNVPTDEFTERTETMVKQFQTDYMEVEPTGLVCGGVFTAIDRFEAAYNFSYGGRFSCPCNRCGGFGLGKFAGQKGDASIRESRRKYEYPGIHRTLVYTLKAMMFYMDRDTEYNLSLALISSGYRCHIDNANKGRSSTNHMGKAIDIQLNQNGRANDRVNTAHLGRHEFMMRYSGAQLRWGGSNRISLEPAPGKGSGVNSWPAPGSISTCGSSRYNI